MNNSQPKRNQRLWLRFNSLALAASDFYERGLKKDGDYWARRAKDCGHMGAVMLLVKQASLDRRNEEARLLLSMAIDAGYSPAKFYLAEVYDKGQLGLEKDYSATPGGLNATSMYVVISVASAPNCAAGTVSWGPSNFCSASVSEANPSASISVTNAAVGATGSGTAVCSASATWSVTNATCTSSLMVPSTVIATQGTIAGGIKVTWNAVSGASTYEISYRKQGATTWTTASNVTSGYQLSTTDESVFEFMVRGANPAGPGDWSGVVTGYVRPQIMVLDSLKRLSETGPDAGNGENMTPKIIKVFILAMLAMYAFSVHAVTSTFYNKSQSRVSVRFYSRANQSTGMVQQGSEVLLNAGSSRTFSGPGDAGEFYVRNDGISTVSVYVVTDSNPPDYIGYGDLYSGNGVYSVFIGGGASAEARDSAPVECSATPVRWGTGNFCSATPVTTANGGIANLTNSSAGATGSAVATCSAGTWTVSSASCTVSLVAPIGLFATDAANTNSINITWGASQGATSYRLQSRKVGSATWTDLATPSTASYSWTGLSDESIFEFQVRAENSLGSSPWSAVETGSIRPKLAPTMMRRDARSSSPDWDSWNRTWP